MDYVYRFPVVRGIQAGSEYYIAMVPLKMLSKLFSTDEEEYIPPEYRAQRRLNESRIPVIEYSRAVTPQIRQAGNRLSGLAETAYASLLA